METLFHFESTELIKWRSFRASEDSRYVTLTLPHVLMRLPYGPDTIPVDGFDFRENVNGKDPGKYLWGSSAYLLATNDGCSAATVVDTTADVAGEPRAYRSSNSVDIFVCPRMSHMHNFAGTRVLFWERIARFADWAAYLKTSKA